MAINELGKTYERPWGSYKTLELGANFQVKIITINPGGILSLQKHFKRSEHWVVVTGSPTLTLDQESKTYQVNEHLYIPIEALHRMENHTDEIAQLVEVQIGHYLGEDDIVRFEDKYGRV